MFGPEVQAHRRRLGLTQEELAHRTGLGVRTIRGLEAGTGRVPRPASVRLLADAFGLSGGAREEFRRLAAGESSGGPEQLPADVAPFTGRGAELARLDALLAAGSGSPAVVISALAGTAGVGKTALAVHWAHRVRHRFPDGQLYLNLRGYDPDRPLPAVDALARFLTALGVAAAGIPLDPDDRAALFRSTVVRRRMLLVLDNAATVEQVRPLLPGTPSCAVVVTSRDRLSGLVARHGAHRLDLDPLPPTDARTLLRRLIGARVDADPVATDALADRCSRLPLALRLAAELAAARPGTPLASLVGELTGYRRRLDLLDAGGDPRSAVEPVFSWSLRALPPVVVAVFHAAGAHPGPDFDAYGIAALADLDHDAARDALDVLARAHLVHATAAGRFGMHDLLRAYAVAQAPPADAAAATARLVDHLVATAAAAMDSLYPAEAHRRPTVPPARTPAPDLTDAAAARAWLDVERPGLVAIAGRVVDTLPEQVVRLSGTLYRYLAGGHHLDALALHGHADAAAARTGDRAGRARACIGLGAAYMQMARFEPAREQYERARVLFEADGDPNGTARAAGSLGNIEERLGRFREAAGRYRVALDLFRQDGDVSNRGWILMCLGVVEQRLGALDRAREHIEEALRIYRDRADRSGEAYALTCLGDVEERAGRSTLAEERQRAALDLFRQLGNRAGEAWALDGIGNAHRHLGRHDSSTDHHRRALDLFRDTGNSDGQAWALNGLGDTAREAGDPATAVTHHRAALALVTGDRARDQQARAHAGLGHALRALGDDETARTHLGTALRLLTDLEMPEAAQVAAHLP